MRNLTIVFHDAGGGHRNAAVALKAVLEAQDYPWNVRLVNLQELLEPIDLVHGRLGTACRMATTCCLEKAGPG